MAIAFLLIILSLFLYGSIDLSIRNTKLINDNARLIIENRSLHIYLMTQNTMASLEKSSNKNDINKQTKQLIILAIKNNNENEAKNAALKACQKLHKELKL